MEYLMSKSKREFIKAYEWSKFDQITSDQQKGLLGPDLQKAIPPNAMLVALISPDECTIGGAPAISQKNT